MACQNGDLTNCLLIKASMNGKKGLVSKKNKTKYFRLRLSDESSTKRPATDLREKDGYCIVSSRTLTLGCLRFPKLSKVTQHSEFLLLSASLLYVNNARDIISCTDTR